jgi:hypothetical protein
MFYIRLTVLGVLSVCTVNASKENLPPIDEPLNASAAPSSALKHLEQNIHNLTVTNLKCQRHRLRMSLMKSQRTRSIAPPTGEARRQMELKLSEVESALTQKYEQQ